MNRLTYAYICYGASLAIVLAIALLPFSGWAFRNHLDVLTGGWQSSTSDYYAGNGEQIQPTRATYGWTISGQFGLNGAKGYPLEETFASYAQNAQAHPNDPAALAHVIRQNFMAPYNVGGDLKLDPRFWTNYKLDQVRDISLSAALQGMKVDPDNAYFGSMAAILLDWKGRREDAYEALRKAAAAKRFDEYADREGRDRTQAIDSHWGYRGEKVRAVALSSILLPHWAVQKHYAKELQSRPKTKENVQAQADMLRIAQTMEKTDPYLIGVLIGAALADDVLLPPPPKTLPGRPEPKRDLNLNPQVVEFNTLQRQLKVDRPFDPAPLARTVPRIRSVAQEMNGTLSDPLEGYFSWQATAYPPIFLLAFITSVLMAALTSKMKEGSELPRRLVPYVGALTFMWLVTEFAPFSNFVALTNGDYRWGSAPPDLSWTSFLFTVTMSVLGLLQIWKPMRKPATMVAIAVCVAGSFITYPVAYLFAPTVVFVALYLLVRLRWKMPYILIALLLGISTLAMATGYGDLAFHGAEQIATAIFIGAGLFFTILLLPNGSRRALAVMPALTLLFATGYLAATIREIKQNQEIKVGLDGWSREADLMRARAGID